jgi:hypothetical protein
MESSAISELYRTRTLLEAGVVLAGGQTTSRQLAYRPGRS